MQALLKGKCLSTSQFVSNPPPFLVIYRSCLFSLPVPMFTWRDLHQESTFWVTDSSFLFHRFAAYQKGSRIYSEAANVNSDVVVLRSFKEWEVLWDMFLSVSQKDCEASRNGKFFGTCFFPYLRKIAFPKILQKNMIHRQLSHGDRVFPRPCACV